MNESVPINNLETNLDMIKLGNLALHSGNVRKTATNKEADIAPLAASIASVGLINPLIVILTSTGEYGVVAGGCRLIALRMLAEQNKLPEELQAGIPCKVLKGKPNLEEISLVENIMRQDMTAVDQIEAWGALVKDGTAADVIAARFGVTEALVHQRLALANVAPEVLELFRKEDIALDTVKAFTLTDDHDKQRQVLAEIDGHISAWQVRSMLRSSKVLASDKRVRFIGLEAYTEAGGKVIHDLFDPDEAMIENEELLDTLVAAKFETERERVLSQGWSWAEYKDGDNFEHRWKKFTQEHPTPSEQTPEETARIEEIEQILSDAEEDEWGEPVGVDCDALNDEHEKLLEQIEARQFWPDDIKAKGGVFLNLSYDGTISYSAGWIPREKKNTAQVGDESEESTSKATYSGSLRETLQELRTQIVREAITRTDTLCNDIILFDLVRSLAHSYYNIGVIGYNRDPDRNEDNPKYPCFDEILGFRAKLDDSWRGGDTVAEEFKLFQALPEASKQAWSKVVVMQSISARLSDHANINDDGLESIIDTLNIDWAKTYRPGTDFFSKLTKSAMLEMVRPALGDEWIENNTGKKKTVLVELLAEIVAGRGAGITAAQQAAMDAWVPTGFVPRAAPTSDNEEDAANTDQTPDEAPENTSEEETIQEPQGPDNDTTPQALSADSTETPAFLDD